MTCWPISVASSYVGLSLKPENVASMLVAAEAEVALGLATDGDDRVVLAGEHVGLDLALGGALDAGVVAAAQAAVGADDDVGSRLRTSSRPASIGELRRAASGGEVLDHLGDLLAVRHGGGDALLGLDDPRRGDQLHGARDLLRRLDAYESVPAGCAPAHLPCVTTPSPVSCSTARRRARRRRSASGSASRSACAVAAG